MFHYMGIRMSVVFKEETNCWCFGALSEIASGLSKELKSTVIAHVPVSSALSYPAALLLSMRRFCVRMKHALWCGHRIKEKGFEWYCEAAWFEYLIQSKDPFARRACAIGTITMLLFSTEVLLLPDFQMMCPGVLQVNACTNRENSKVLSDGRMVMGLLLVFLELNDGNVSTKVEKCLTKLVENRLGGSGIVCGALCSRTMREWR